MDLDQKTLYTIYYDYYGNLLTPKQKELFNAYFFEDYSLSEIASCNGVSRNAIFDAVKKVMAHLDKYESKLQLYKRDQKLLAILDDAESGKIDLMTLIKKIKEME